ncbi:MAG TPA: hypothetical protein VLJ10_03445 [Candidatus Bathyarchaeia archaeon]|nr:hypothetical protein [Candidatus Bathyarchaeia archaeon]
MSKRQMMIWVLVWGVVSAGLAAPRLWAQDRSASFVIPLLPEMFLPDTTIQVKVYNIKNQSIIEQVQNVSQGLVPNPAEPNRKEVIIHDTDLPVPESFVFKDLEEGMPVGVRTKSIRRGDTYYIRVSATYNEGCSSASGVGYGQALADQMILENFQWSVSALPCKKSKK